MPPIRSCTALIAILLSTTLLPQGAGTQTPALRWTARWIAAPPAPDQSAPLPLFRHRFTVQKKIARATLSISGLGQYEAHINGQNVTTAVLTPGWTDYRHRVFYNTYNVTALVKPGGNAIGVLLGNGMYNVQETPGRYTKFTGPYAQPRLILQLNLRFTDGTQQTIATGDTWKTAPGPITFTSAYGGEDFDARLIQPGWDTPSFNDHAWSNATLIDGPGGALTPETTPPVKAFDLDQPLRITHPKPGIAVYDLGQNFAGWPELDVTGQRGASVKLIAGELLDANGLVSQRSAHAFPNSQNSFTYTLSGAGSERWHPRFSYYGFRYVQVESSGPQPVTINHLTGSFLHDDVAIDGTFTSSSDLFNRIHTLIDRAMLSNMVSVLTDCPHREKLGWLEQTHLAGASLMYNYNLAALYAKMANDMQDAQLPNGLVPDIAPEFTTFSGSFRDSPEWGSAVILSTWTAYQFYGDTALLRDHYTSMQRYAAYLHQRSKDGLLAYGLGDWYDIGPRPPGESQLTTKGLTATAIHYQSLTALTRIATLLGHPDDAAKYTAERDTIKAAFNARFFHPAINQYDTGSQTANAMPLVLGLVPDGHAEAVLANLVADIRAHNNHVTAGDIGFHYVVRALTDNDRSGVLYDMLSRTDKPSYGDQLAHGATTLTEAWDANPESSQNHFMLGHAEEWFYRGLAGIDVDLSRAPNDRIRIHPAIVGDLTSVSATFHARPGTIASAWTRTGDALTLTITIPTGATATILLPTGYTRAITINGGSIRSSPTSSIVVHAGTCRIRARRTAIAVSS